MKKERKSKSLVMLGSLLILLGIFLVAYDIYNVYQKINNEKIAIQEFYNNEEIINEKEDNIEETEVKKETNESPKINYVAVLKIPKINLERGLVNRNSYLNDVKYNIQILKDSDNPDVKNGNVILASHSGNSRVSYFRNLNKLTYEDEVYLIYNGKTYYYRVVDMYDVEKNGTVEIIKNKDTTTLTLITCRHNTNKQIVVICELVEIK